MPSPILTADPSYVQWENNTVERTRGVREVFVAMPTYSLLEMTVPSSKKSDSARGQATNLACPSELKAMKESIVCLLWSTPDTCTWIYALVDSRNGLLAIVEIVVDCSMGCVVMSGGPAVVLDNI